MRHFDDELLHQIVNTSRSLTNFVGSNSRLCIHLDNCSSREVHNEDISLQLTGIVEAADSFEEAPSVLHSADRMNAPSYTFPSTDQLLHSQLARDACLLNWCGDSLEQEDLLDYHIDDLMPDGLEGSTIFATAENTCVDGVRCTNAPETVYRPSRINSGFHPLQTEEIGEKACANPRTEIRP
ncbi:unnamed protein product, partial [Protopolystoma xenopodis]